MTNSKINKLLLVTDEEKKAVLKHYNITEKELDETIQYMMDWKQKFGLPDYGKDINCFSY